MQTGSQDQCTTSQALTASLSRVHLALLSAPEVTAATIDPANGSATVEVRTGVRPQRVQTTIIDVLASRRVSLGAAEVLRLVVQLLAVAGRSVKHARELGIGPASAGSRTSAIAAARHRVDRKRLAGLAASTFLSSTRQQCDEAKRDDRDAGYGECRKRSVYSGTGQHWVLLSRGCVGCRSWTGRGWRPSCFRRGYR